MNANELRIGNLIKWKSTDCIEQVKDIVTLGKPNTLINNVLVNDCQPIPITEEWLVIFGFQNQEFTKFWRCDEWEELYFIGGILHFNVDGKTIAIVERVHELQNLYFALTHKELTLNQDK